MYSKRPVLHFASATATQSALKRHAFALSSWALSIHVDDKKRAQTIESDLRMTFSEAGGPGVTSKIHHIIQEADRDNVAMHIYMRQVCR